MKLYQILIYVPCIFPVFINALKCQYGEICELQKSNSSELLNFERQERNEVFCEDSCVYYKCVIPGQKIKEGAGCFSTFEQACGFIKTETKTKIIDNLKNDKFEYFDEALMFASCRNGDNCAKDAFKKMITVNPGAENNFASLMTEAKDGCPFPLPYVEDHVKEKVKCSLRQVCDTGKNYDVRYAGGDVENHNLKFCDACVYYRCTTNGSKIMSGVGCFDDFKDFCRVADRNVVKSIKENIKNSFHFGPNFVVVSCSSGRNCHKHHYKSYMDVYPNAALKVDRTVDGTCNFSECLKQPRKAHN